MFEVELRGSRTITINEEYTHTVELEAATHEEAETLAVQKAAADCRNIKWKRLYNEELINPKPFPEDHTIEATECCEFEDPKETQ